MSLENLRAHLEPTAESVGARSDTWLPEPGDIGAVTQSICDLVPQNGIFEVFPGDRCCLLVTGKLATVIARMRCIKTGDLPSTKIFELPVRPDGYVDGALQCGKDNRDNMAVQISPDGSLYIFSGNYNGGPYSVSLSFLIR